MLGWLSDWLKSIIAVVLLAAVIDLLLPGKTFQRYTRLVLGLLILLAMLGPILKLFDAEPELLLDRGIRSWEAASSGEVPKMPALGDIQRDAAELRQRQERQAAELTQLGIETAILEALNRSGGPRAEAVRVGLAAGSDHEMRISAVTVTLAAVRTDDGEQADDGMKEDGINRLIDGGRNGRSGAETVPIEPVREVNVTIGPDAPSAGRQPEAAAVEEPSAGRHAAERDAAFVRSIVYSGWGVEPERIIVLSMEE